MFKDATKIKRCFAKIKRRFNHHKTPFYFSERLVFENQSVTSVFQTLFRLW